MLIFEYFCVNNVMSSKKIVEHLVEAGKVLITIIIPAAVNWLLKIVLGKRK